MHSQNEVQSKFEAQTAPCQNGNMDSFAGGKGNRKAKSAFQVTYWQLRGQEFLK
jgi:hypothetical protein